MAKIKGIAYWAALHQPNTTYTPKFQIDVVVDLATKEALESQGIIAKEDEERGGFVVKASINQFKADGTLNAKPTVVDRDNNPTDAQIGNGSTVHVLYHPYEWAYAGKTGVKCILDGVQIEKLVKYEGRDEFEALPEEDVELPDSNAL